MYTLQGIYYLASNTLFINLWFYYEKEVSLVVINENTFSVSEMGSSFSAAILLNALSPWAFTILWLVQTNLAELLLVLTDS